MEVEPTDFRRELARVLNINRDRVFAIDARSMKQLTYAEFSELVDRFSALFRSRGLAAGDSIISLLPNSVEQLAVIIATMRDGYGFAPLAPQTTTVEVKRFALLVRAKLCLHSTSSSSGVVDLLDRLELDHIVAPLGMDFSWLPKKAADTPGQSATAPVGRLYLGTSGTTGEPKAMVIDPASLWASAKAFAAKHDFIDPSSRFFNILPMSYLGGLFNLGLIPLAAGASTCIDEPFSGRSTLSFWNDIQRMEINTLWLVPTMINSLLQMTERKSKGGSRNGTRYPKVRASLLGTAPIELNVKERFENAFGIPLIENYALSETTFLSTETIGSRFDRIPGSTGHVLDYVDLEIRHDAAASGAQDADTAAGEIAVRTPYAFIGYLNADGSMDIPFDDRGFLMTGDIGYVDPNGNLIIVGRVKDIIKKGGLVVSLPEIDRVATECDGVSAAAAVPVKHAFYGEDVALAIVPADPDADAGVLIEKVRQHMMNNLIRYKWPSTITVVDALPATASGKIKRLDLAGQITIISAPWTA